MSLGASLDPTLTNKEFLNWIKAALAIHFAKEGLTELVQSETLDLHKYVLQSVFEHKGISPGTTCSSCTTANLLSCPTPNFCKRKRCHEHDEFISSKKPNLACTNGICNSVKDAVRCEHTFSEPSWKNTDARRWCSDPLEITKCFMPPDGYSDKKSLAETDFIGIISVITSSKRFLTRMTAKLNIEPNIFSKVRDVGLMVRHCAACMLSDLELGRCYDALRDLLRDAEFLRHYTSAQVAVQKLDELQNNTLVINAGDLTKAVSDDVREAIGKEQREAVNIIHEHLFRVQTESVAALESVIASKTRAVLHKFHQKAGEEKQELIRLSQNFVCKLDQKIRPKVDAQDLDDLIEDLIEYYMDNELMIPASPFIEEYAVPLMDFYVQPPMFAFNKPCAFGPDENLSDKTVIKSYKQLLFKNDNVPYRKIYISADAGMGKTSFSKKITMTWCQAKMPNQSVACKFDAEETDTLRCFQIVFLIHLRDYQNTNICLLDDMIYDMVSKTTSRNHKYSKEFIQMVLHQENCLIICDGLDEWTHSEDCSRTPQVPHNNHPKSCTVMTTTRPWKLSTIALPPNQIDRHVEISELNKDTSQKLKMNAIQLFNTKNESGEDSLQKGITDFDKEVSALNLEDFLRIPYILLQIFCLWRNEFRIGESKCEIYCNITEMTIARGMKKKNQAITSISEQSTTMLETPKCLVKNKLCNCNIHLLYKLAELSFATLFSINKESTLVIDSETVLKYLTEQEMDFCLKAGLLSQTKDKRLLTKILYKVSFQHKSIQEFYAALHIASRWENSTLQTTILSVCTSLSSILEMTNVFVFLCGLRPEVFFNIFTDLRKVAACDEITYKYRADIHFYTELSTIKSYQSMQLSCMKESARNGHEISFTHPQDIVIARPRDDEVPLLNTLNISYKAGSIKSFYIYENTSSVMNDVISFISALDHSVYNELETLRVRTRTDNFETAIVSILIKQAHTLKCLELSRNSLVNFSYKTTTIMPLSGLTALQTLTLSNIKMPHMDTEYILSFISSHTVLRQLRLKRVVCQEHCNLRECATLNLSQVKNLEKLDLSNVEPVNEIRLNTACLNYCKISGLNMAVSAKSSLCEDLRGASVLSSLVLHNINTSQQIAITIPTLMQIQNLKIWFIDMNQDKLYFSPEMTRLEHIELGGVTMVAAAWREMLLTAGELPRCVTMELRSCNKASLQEWQDIVNEIVLAYTVEIIEGLTYTDVKGASLSLTYKKD